jgi:Uma2 family endonuclease
VVRGTDAFDTRHPESREAVLVIEITSGSRGVDQRKADIYAAAGVQTYWRLDILARRLEVFHDPDPSGKYSSKGVFDERAALPLPALDGVSLNLAELLPADSG